MNARYIDKYEIVSICGHGPVGTVYKARDTEFGEILALKAIRVTEVRGKATDAEVIGRFKEVATSVCMLKHPNIVIVLNSGYVDDGTLFIVTKYAEGESLETMISRRNRFGNQELLHYLGQIASAIDYAHSRGVLHGNIKPSNVIVDANHKVHVLDFGLMRFMTSLVPSVDTVPRSPDYMAPEQIRGEAVDDAIDIFALGVVAFEMFTARLPFGAKDFTTVANNILHKAPVSLSHSGRKLSSEVESILHRALAKNPKERYSSALAFVGDLGKVLDIMVDGRGLLGGFSPNANANKNIGGEGDRKEVDRAEKLDLSKRSGLRAMVEWSLREREKSQLSATKGRTALNDDRLFASRSSAGVTGGGAMPEGRENARGKSNPSSEEISSLGLFRKLKIVVTICAIAIGVTIVGALSFSRTSAISNEASEERLSQASAPPVDYEKIKLSEVREYDDELLASLLRSQQMGIKERRILISEAGKRSGEEFTEILGTLAASGSDLIRVSVATALSLRPHWERSNGFRALTSLAEDENYLVRGYAAKALAKTGKPEARAFLERRLEVEEDKVVKTVLNEVLGHSGDLKAVEELVD